MGGKEYTNLNIEDLETQDLEAVWFSHTNWYYGNLSWSILYIPSADDIVHRITFKDKHGNLAFQTFPNQRQALKKWNEVSEVFKGKGLPSDFRGILDEQTKV